MTNNHTWTNHTPTAMRRHHYGKVRSLARDARAIGEPSLAHGVLILAAGLTAVAGVVLLAGWLAA